VTKSDEGVTWFARTTGLAENRVQSLAGRGGEVWCVAANRVYRGGETGAWTLSEEGLPATPSYSIRARGDTLLLGTGVGVFRRVGAADWQPLGVDYPGNAWVDFADDGAPAGNVEGLWNWDLAHSAAHAHSRPGGTANGPRSRLAALDHHALDGV
jgi:hypothetical protein